MPQTMWNPGGTTDPTLVEVEKVRNSQKGAKARTLSFLVTALLLGIDGSTN